MINVVVLCAGKGQRFKDAGYTESKPFIQVRGKTILEHMTESTGFILHDFGKQRSDINLVFALREDDQKYEPFLKSKYGHNSFKIKWISKSRSGGSGNLATAFDTVIDKIYQKREKQRLLILDCDNKFYYPDLDRCFWQRSCIGAIFHNDPSDHKWANLVISESKNVVERIEEKNPEYSHLPRAVGIFGFATTDSFVCAAEKVIENNVTTNGEYYMSSVYQHLDPMAYPLYLENQYYIPLGTPEDVRRFEND